MFSSWTISLDAPTVVSHHMFIPSTLIPFFYELQILVESLILLITDCTKIFQEVHQDGYAKNEVWCLCFMQLSILKFSKNYWTIFYFRITEKAFCKVFFKWKPYILLELYYCSEMLISIIIMRCRTCGSWNTQVTTHQLRMKALYR